VRFFLSAAGLDQYLASAAFEAPIDGITLVQRYIKAPEPFITRAEFVGGKFLYAVRVDASQGFQLCPADACQTEIATAAADVSPVTAPSERFRVIEGIDGSLIAAYERFLRANHVGIAAIEFIADGQGGTFTYDVNTNTNYNPDAEAKAGKFGMRAIARYLTDLFAHRAAHAA